MAHSRKASVFTTPRNARLEELLLLFGCGDEIAPFDADALAKSAGELIASVSSYQPKPLLRSSMPSQLTKTRTADMQAA
jgi:hypothetical protein